MCLICGWIYDEATGAPDHGIAPGTPWSEVPMNWTCPEFRSRGDAVIQGRRFRPATRAHGRLAGLPDQTVYQGPAAADRAAVRCRQRRSDVMAIQKILVVDDSKTELMFMRDLL